jgi:hypothetical protein
VFVYINLNISAFRALPTPEYAVPAPIAVIVVVAVAGVATASEVVRAMRNRRCSSVRAFMGSCRSIWRTHFSTYYQMLLLLRFSIDRYFPIVVALFLLGFLADEHHRLVDLLEGSLYLFLVL